MARKLTPEEIKVLAANGCTAESWDQVTVADGFKPERVRHCYFTGTVTLGRNDGQIKIDGVPYPAGLYQAVIANSDIGDNVLIRNVGTHVSNYTVDAGAVIMDVDGLSSSPDTTFGQGTLVEAVNEAGGREISLSEHLTSQIAFLLSAYRYRPALVKAVERLLDNETRKLKGQKGLIGKGAVLMNCGAMVNVRIGDFARITGVTRLSEGTVVSCAEDPAILGDGVTAERFVVLEGGHVTGHAVLAKVFVGQGVRIGKQFSAENALFFANSEGFHGEACSIFAGPYSVTHHKSTLLIASMYSFYNAGSGTNHSNHMYKLGPVHQGVLERGCKTGSFSYLLLEAHLAPFCIVIGKHMSNINIPDLPFSYITESGGKSHLTPAMNLITIGTVRDQEKWASRDRRKTERKTDLINPAVYSPYTVEKMIRGRNLLMKLYKETPKDVESVNVGGTILSRLLMKNCAKYYIMTIERYLYQHLFVNIERELKRGLSWAEALKTAAPELTGDADWADLSGMLCPRSALEKVLACLESGKIASVQDLADVLSALNTDYAEHEKAYVWMRFVSETGINPMALTQEKALEMLESWKAVSRKVSNLTLADAEKEFDDFAKISYGLDGSEADAAADFTAVRGEKETNKVLVKLRQGVEQFASGVDALIHLVRNAK